jgi:hypothetical protein
LKGVRQGKTPHNEDGRCKTKEDQQRFLQAKFSCKFTGGDCTGDISRSHSAGQETQRLLRKSMTDQEEIEQ